MKSSMITSLYLSRLMLNPRSRQVMSELAHPYEMHRTIMRAFPQSEDNDQNGAREEFGVLFRAEGDDPLKGVKVYVQSRVAPSWEYLEGLGNYLLAEGGSHGHECKDIMPSLKRIQTGQVVSFRLLANPTKRIGKADDPMKGKRVELWREEDQINWLIRKGKLSGKSDSGAFDLLVKTVRGEMGEDMSVPRVNVRVEGKTRGRKRDSKAGHATTHLAVRFDGLLQVTNAHAFLDLIASGIGSGKAFGFGLLSVAPANTSG